MEKGYIMKTLLRYLLIACVLCPLTFANSTNALANEQKKGDTKPNTPAKVEMRRTQVSVSHEGLDTIGIKLATRLKELFNASNLFTLNEKNITKMRIIITSKAEFKDRPHVGSVYSLLWVFSQNDENLGYLLAQDVNVLSNEDIDDVANKIVSRTDGLAVKFGYLFK